MPNPARPTNYNYNTLDQLTSATGVGAASYRYDGRGNLLVITSGLNITNYSYDYANRLTKAVLPSGGGTYTYVYDADGRRVSQTGSGSTTSYLWDEQGLGNVALEVNGTNITNYLLGEGNLLSQNRAGSLSDYLPDGNGNIRALTGGSGSISDLYNYDAYGNTTHLLGGTNLNPYQYKGQQYDPATALYNLRARYYTPSSGRFLSRDTASFDIQNPVELNRYVYVADNPVDNFDPGGKLLIDIAVFLGKISLEADVSTSREGQNTRNLIAGEAYVMGSLMLSAAAASQLPDSTFKQKGCLPGRWTWASTVAYSELGIPPNDFTGGLPFFPVAVVKGPCKPFNDEVIKIVTSLGGEAKGSKTDDAEVALYKWKQKYLPVFTMGFGTFWAIGVNKPLCGSPGGPDPRGGWIGCYKYFGPGGEAWPWMHTPVGEPDSLSLMTLAWPFVAPPEDKP